MQKCRSSWSYKNEIAEEGFRTGEGDVGARGGLMKMTTMEPKEGLAT
jgi:hypothetical protein